MASGRVAERLRAVVKWLRSPGSPSDHPEADIRTHRWMAFAFTVMAAFFFFGALLSPTPSLEWSRSFTIFVAGGALLFALASHFDARANRWRAYTLKQRVEALEDELDDGGEPEGEGEV